MVNPRTLAQLGFNSYPEYLNSPLWAKIRGRVLDRDGYTCLKCGDRANNVHHRKYDLSVMRGDIKKLKFLVSLCRKCHVYAEFDDGRKTTTREANERLNLITNNGLKGKARNHCKDCGCRAKWMLLIIQPDGRFRCPKCISKDSRLERLAASVSRLNPPTPARR